MLFIETEIFTRAVTALLSDDEYGEFQRFLATQPCYGDVIPETGGFAKRAGRRMAGVSEAASG